jgi:hypothetical protein
MILDVDFIQAKNYGRDRLDRPVRGSLACNQLNSAAPYGENRRGRAFDASGNASQTMAANENAHSQASHYTR